MKAVVKSVPGEEQEESCGGQCSEERGCEDAKEQGRGSRGNGAGRALGRKRRIQDAYAGKFAGRAASAGRRSLRFEFIIVFGEFVGHGRKCYSVG